MQRKRKVKIKILKNRMGNILALPCCNISRKFCRDMDFLNDYHIFVMQRMGYEMEIVKE